MRQTINQTLPFRDMKIHIIPEKDGSVKWVSLLDVCHALKRREMYDNGEALRICKTQRKFPIYTNGKLFWFISSHEIHALTNKVRKENESIAAICDELLEWVENLPKPDGKYKITKKKDTKAKPVDNTTFTQDENGLIIFQYHDQPISFKADNGKVYYNATQMARSFNTGPREWLNMAKTKEFRESLVKLGKSENYENQVIASRGTNGTTWIEERLGIEFARWLSPEFSHWCNDRMQDLLTNGIVTLKKTDEKIYTTSYGVEMKLPDDFEEALEKLLDSVKLIGKQQKKIEEDRPKVEFYNDFIENRDSFKTSIIAEELRISTIRLYEFLREENIVYQDKRKVYVATPGYRALQTDHNYYYTYKNTGKQYVVGVGKRWTPDGRIFILDLYRKKNPGMITR